MNNLKVVIIEDEKITAENLAKLILKISPNARVMAMLSSVKQATAWLSMNHADLIFMDIELGDGQSFNIFDQVAVSSPVIFTTAYDQYAIKAFKKNGIDYLLKPIDESELKAAMVKYQNLVGKTPDFTLLRDLISSASTVRNYKQRFMIQAGSRIRTVPVSEIAYFYFSGKDTFICTFENRHYPAEYSLDKLEDMIDPDVYFRINRKMILSIKSIQQIYSLSKSRLKLELNPAFEEEVLVSFNKTTDFRNWLNK
jgi:two-component system, LytTR family, response regulator LytT